VARLPLVGADHLRLQPVSIGEESLAIFRELGVAGYIQNALDGLGCVLCAQGELDRAAAALAEGLAHSKELGDDRMLLSILGHIAEVAVRQGDDARAARLAGAVAAGQDATGIALPPVDQAQLKRAMSRARRILGAQPFTWLREKGRSMSLQEVVTYALDDTEPIEPNAACSGAAARDGGGR
jgi:hypothetical protein